MPSRSTPPAPARPRASRPRALSLVGPLTPHLYLPTPQRPVRAKRHRLACDTQVVPHCHPWGQLSFSTSGVTRLTVAHGTYIVPPSRVLWIPPGVEHAVTVLEDSELLTLYLHQTLGRTGPGLPAGEDAPWRQCRVLEVSNLLRALVPELDTRPDDGPALSPAELLRQRRLSTLVLDELQRARPVRLGVDMPQDKRLRALCEAVLDDPTRHATLEGWARDSGASPRTVARLFRDELGTSFVQWRQQVLLARALSMAARHQPMSHIAAELGYASASAFTAMVKRAVGEPPSRFFGQHSTSSQA